MSKDCAWCCPLNPMGYHDDTATRGIYLLVSNDGSCRYYLGQTTNYVRRLKSHKYKTWNFYALHGAQPKWTSADLILLEMRYDRVLRKKLGTSLISRMSLYDVRKLLSWKK